MGCSEWTSDFKLICMVVSFIEPWFPDEINNGYTEYLYFLLGGLMLLNFVAFLIIAKFYQYREVEENLETAETLKHSPDVEPGKPPAYENPAFHLNQNGLVNDRSESTRF